MKNLSKISVPIKEYGKIRDVWFLQIITCHLSQKTVGAKTFYFPNSLELADSYYECQTKLDILLGRDVYYDLLVEAV